MSLAMASSCTGALMPPRTWWRTAVETFVDEFATYRPYLPRLIPLIMWLVLFPAYGEVPIEFKPTVDVSTLPTMEYAFFGTFPHRILGYYHNAFLDVVAAVVYGVHFLVPFVTPPILIYYRSKNEAFTFAFSLGLMNLISITSQFLFPMAPPWYYEAYGTLPADYSMRGNAAGLLRVDELTGTDTFRNMYGMSAIVFGAFPSLHSAWPTMVALFSGHLYWWAYPVIIYWAAGYLTHHFMMDVMGGIAFAVFFTHLGRYLFMPAKDGADASGGSAVGYAHVMQDDEEAGMGMLLPPLPHGKGSGGKCRKSSDAANGATGAPLLRANSSGDMAAAAARGGVGAGAGGDAAAGKGGAVDKAKTTEKHVVMVVGAEGSGSGVGGGGSGNGSGGGGMKRSASCVHLTHESTLVRSMSVGFALDSEDMV